MAAAPTLVLVAHGSRAAHGDDAAVRVAAALGERRPGHDVCLAFLGNGTPLLGDALAALAGDGTDAAVVVPLLLSTGVHATTDIEAALARTTQLHPQMAVTSAGPLGPDASLVRAVRDRIAEAGATAPGAVSVVLAAAGSTDPQGIADVERTAAMLRSDAAYDQVTVGFVGGAQPDLASAIDAVRIDGSAIVVVPYLLGQGHFANVVRDTCAGVIVTEPIGSHDAVTELVLERYDAAAAALS